MLIYVNSAYEGSEHEDMLLEYILQYNLPSWSMAIVPQYHSCWIYDRVLGLRWCNHVNILRILQECFKIDLVSDR
jgi:hypothetical protein